MEKYCEDCEHFEKGQERIQGMPSMCHSPENPGALVKRGEGAVECWAARSNEHKCGKAGKWFVSRHESVAEELEMTPGPYHSVDGVEYTYDKAAGAWRPTGAARHIPAIDYGNIFPKDKSKLFRHACNDAVYTFNGDIGVWVLYFPQNPNNEQYFYDTVRGRLWMYLASRDDWVELMPNAG